MTRNKILAGGQAALRRAAENGVDKGWQRYQELFDFLPDGYLETDTTGIIREANLAAATLLQVNQELLVGQVLLDFVAGGPAERQAFRNQLVRLADLKRVQGWMVKLQPHEGSSFLASLTVGIRHDSGGKPVGLQWLLHDITKRKLAEEATEESQHRLQAMFNNAQNAILFLDDESRLMEANPATYTLLGYSPDELLQMMVWDLMAESNRALARELWQVFLAAGRHSGEFPLRHKDGDTVEVEYRAVANVIPGLHIVVYHDISQRKQAEAEIRQHTARMEALAAISMALAEASLDVQAVLNTIVRYVAEIIGDACVISLLSSDEQWFKPVAFHHPNPEAKMLLASLFTITPLSASNELVVHILQSGQPLLIPIVRQEQIRPGLQPEYLPYLDQVGIHSLLFVPLQMYGQVIGTLGVTRDQPGHSYTLDDQAFLVELADRAALTLQNAQLFEAERRQREMAETLRDTAILLTSTLDLDQVLEHILLRLEQVVTFDSVCIFLLEKESLQVIAGRGFPDSNRVIGLTRPVDDPLFQEVQQTRRPLILADAQADPRFESWDGIGHGRGWMGIPLLVYGKVIGHLALGSWQLAAYGQMEADLAQAFANQAAIAIENARLHTQSVQWTEQLNSLNKAGQTLASSFDLDYILDQVVVEITTLFKAEGASLLLLDAEQAELIFVASISPASERLIGTRMPATAGIAGWVVAERQPVLVDNAQNHPRFYKDIDALTHLTTCSLLAVPMIARNRVIGVIEVINQLEGAFDRSDLELLQALGSSAAIAIENARLFEATHQGEERYRHLFDNSPIAIWEEDYSEVKTYFDQLREEGIRNLSTYFEQHPDEVKRCARLVKVVEVNKASLALYKASNQEEFLTSLDTFFGQEAYANYAKELVAMAAGQTAYEGKNINQTLSGDKINVWFRTYIAPGYETTWSRVLTSIIDITALKQAEAVVKKQRQELRRLSTQLINSQESERKHLAHELHDEMGQALTAIGINLEAIEHDLLLSLPPIARKRLADTISLTDQTLAQVRELSLNLRPSMLDDLGLEAAISWYVKRYTARSNIKVELDTREFGGRLKMEVETALYRVVQEALTNVARHAQAQRVYLRLVLQGASVTLLIKDDGRGFAMREVANRRVKEPSLGLIGIRERVTALGGRFVVQSQPGQGTELFVEVPV